MIYMMNINATNFRKNLFGFLEQTIKYNEPINISTKEGDAIMISEEDDNSILATLDIYDHPILKKKIVDGLHTPLSECIAEDEVDW